jgi:hypothetical protein
MQINGRKIGLDQPIFLTAGACVVEAGFEEVAP